MGAVVGGEKLAILGGDAIRADGWPKWPRDTPRTHEIVADVLSSSRWTVSGTYDGRQSYERQFSSSYAAFNGVRFCTPTSSGTAALTIAMQALGIGPGDEVLVPGLTWVACASSVIDVGATPVLVDCEADTLAMSPDQAREACGERTAAILVVHPFCSVADLDALMALARERGIPLIEDCAQAHGARWRDRPVGTWGTAGCFSMQQSKLLTSGEGGAVITDDPDLYDRLEQLRCDGRRFATDQEIGRLELVEVASVRGRNLCLSELQAGVLLEGLTRLDAENKLRAERAGELEGRLFGIEGVSTLRHDPRVTSRSYYNFVIRLDLDAFAGNSVDVIGRALTAELGTIVSPVYVPLNRHRLLNGANGDLAGPATESLNRFPLVEAERARASCVTLTHPVLLEDQTGVDDITEAIMKVQRQAGELLNLSQEVTLRAF